MKFTEKEIGNLIDTYLGNTDSEFAGEIIEIGKLEYGAKEAGDDSFIHEAEKAISGKRVILAGLGNAGYMHMLLLDEGGIFYEYSQTAKGFSLTLIKPNVTDFS